MDVLSLATLATAISYQKTQNDVGIALVKLAKDSIKQNGENIVDMMEQSVNPHIGQNIDISL